MTRFGPTGRVCAQPPQVPEECGCYLAEVDVLAQGSARPSRNPSGTSSGNNPWPLAFRQDSAEARARFRLPAVTLHGELALVGESRSDNHAHQLMRGAPRR